MQERKKESWFQWFWVWHGWRWVPHRLVWVYQKLLIYWNLLKQTYLRFTENELKENIQWAGRKWLVHVGGERRWIRLLPIVTDIHSLQPKNAEEHSKNNQKTHLLKHLLWYVSTLLLIVIMFRFLFTELFYFICCVLFFVSFFFFLTHWVLLLRLSTLFKLGLFKS